MRAARLIELHKPLEVREIEVPGEQTGRVVVDVHCAALNRRDFYMTRGLYPGIALPVTPGSDAAGTYNERPVVINPGLDWGADPHVQSKRFRILGMPDDGSLAEKVLIPAENVFPMPDHLSWEEAAALPLAGVTAYRALFVKGAAQSGQKVLITGIGGGVALTAMQMALAHDMTVAVTSGSDEKLVKAQALGAHHTANYNNQEWTKAVLADFGECDLIIDSAGGPGFAHMLRLVRPGGRIVVYGGTAGKIQELSPQILFWRQISISGTTMGSPADFRAMLDFVSVHRIVPVIDSVYSLDQINDALSRLEDSTQFGKVVIRIA